MKFTLGWLRDHLETSASVDEVVRTMIMLGLEVEHVHDPASLFATFKSARVLEAVPHPDADKLRVCKVDTGTEVLQVVCGAPNARTGMMGVFAPSGTVVPGTGLELKKAKIRGVESNGMLVSEREMGLSDEHEGIIDLPPDTPIGVPLSTLKGLDDPVIDFEVTPNRPDWNGVEGIARDLAAAGLGRFIPRAVDPVAGEFPSPIEITLHFPGPAEPGCTFFAGRLIRGVTNRESPAWLKRRLEAIGLRPINALVDVTNYISYDRARPLHVYDADKLEGPIGARWGREGESFRALDGRDHAVDGSMCVIADEARVLGLGGIMGGEASGSTLETTSVFLEAALFDPSRIALTGRATGIISDARYRFERGVDPAFCLPGLEMATRMILEICGGSPSEVVVAGKVPSERTILRFRPERVQKLTGLELDRLRIERILKALGFDLEPAGSAFSVTAPTFRPDITGETDLVEEVARVHGFQHLPTVPLPKRTRVTAPVLTERQQRIRWARRLLAARGLREAVTYSFTKEQWAELFGGTNPALSLANPISSELSRMRPTVLVNLLGAVKANVDRGRRSVALFEIGPQYAGLEPNDQTTGIGGVRTAEGERHWSGRVPEADVFAVKADALAVLAELGLPADKLETLTDAPAWYHPGRSGTLRLGPKVMARFGELHPRVLAAMDIKAARVGAFEITLETLPPIKAKGPARPPLETSDLMPLERDFAFLVDGHVSAGTILKATLGADRKLITDARIFDVYQGKGIEPGKKSVAVSITIEPKEKTLTDAEIEAVMQAVIAAVTKATGGTLRAS